MSSIRWKPFYWLGDKCKQFDRYSQLKKSLFEDLKNENEIHVFRSKRGEWGEWFEVWQYNSGKPKIVKEGWN